MIKRDKKTGRFVSTKKATAAKKTCACKGGKCSEKTTKKTVKSVKTKKAAKKA